MRRFLVLLSLSVAALLATPFGVLAQTTTGTIDGVILDPNGVPLPGVTVVANSPSLIQADLTVVSNANGYYRLNFLSPGTYEVEFRLQNFQTLQRTGVIVSVGQNTMLDADLAVAAVAETTVVTGEVPIIDPRTAKTSFTYTSELAENIPTARTMDALFATIPGVETVNNFGGGIQPGTTENQNVLGAGERSGIYMLDGANTTDPAGQWNTQSLMPYDIVDEIQLVKSAKPAEYPFQGGYFNVITKSGGNDFSGTLAGYFADDGLQATNIDRDEVDVSNELVREHELTAALGGRIIRDKLWWFGSARTFGGRSTIFGFPAEINEDVNAFSGKVTYQPRADHRFTATATHWDQEVSHFFFGFSPTQALEEEASAFRPRGGTTVGARWSGIMSEFVIAEAGFNYTDHRFDQALQPNGRTATIDLVTGNRTGSQGTGAGAIRDQDNHLWSFNGSLSWWVPEAAGQHDIKAGFDYTPTTSQLGFDEPGDHQLNVVFGRPRIVRFLNTPTTAIWENDAVSLYAQDTWTIADRLTLNFGFRYIYTHASTPEQPAGGGQFADTELVERFPEMAFTILPPKELVTWNSVEPRFAASYLLDSAGRNVLRVGASRYYHDLPSFTMFVLTPAFPVTWGTLWIDRNGDRAYQIGEEGPLFFSFGGQLNDVDPDLQRPYTNEFVIGTSHEVSSNTQVSANFIYRRDYRLPSTVDSGVPFDTYTPVDLVDPGPDGVEGTGDDATITAYAQDPDTVGDSRLLLTNPPGNERTYTGVELTASRRFSDNWQGVASLVWSEMEVLRPTTALSVPGLYDSPNGLINAKGLDPANQTLQVKLQGTYTLDFGLNVSGLYRYRTGNPYTRELVIVDDDRFPQGDFNIRAEPRGSSLTDSVHVFDLRFDQEFGVSVGRIGVILDLFNLFNTNATVDEGSITGVNYGETLSVMQPRVARLGLRFTW